MQAGATTIMETNEAGIDTAGRLRRVVGRLSRLLRPTEAGIAAGLTPARASMLLNVDRQGPMRVSELAAQEGLNPTMLSRMIGDLVAEGLLERSCDPDDRRAAWVQITTAGAALAERMRHQRTEAVTAALQGLDRRQARLIEQALPALEALVEQLQEARPS